MASKIKVNGLEIEISSGNVSILNGTVIIDGKVVKGLKKDLVDVTIEGNVNNVDCRGNVTVKGNVAGDVEAGGSVTCKDVGKEVDAGGSVRCSKVGSDIDAGGSVVVR